jgi:hypothetical protein
MPDPVRPLEYILGIDLGVGSVGWAIIECKEGQSSSLTRAGVRVFAPAVEGNIETGRDESRNVARRTARLMRRQTWRRSRRNLRVFRLLQSWQLLPEGSSRTPQERHDLLDQLDLNILSSAWFGRRRADNSIPEPMQVQSSPISSAQPPLTNRWSLIFLVAPCTISPSGAASSATVKSPPAARQTMIPDW